jgi:hypothetical protein
MPVSSNVYGLAQQSMLNKEVDFDSDTIRVVLLTSGYTPNLDTHRYRSSLTNEVVGTGYSAGGQVISGKTVSYDASNNTLRLTCNNITWPDSTITARYAVFFVQTGNDLSTPADDPLLVLWDFGENFSSNVGPFNLNVNSLGLITLQA